MATQITVSRDANGDVVANDTVPAAFNPDATVPSGLQSSVRGGSVKVTLGADGEITSSSVTSAKVSSADIAADAVAANPGSILATAVSASGNPIGGKQLTEQSLVSVGQGMQVTLATAQNMGLVTKNELGIYTDVVNAKLDTTTPAPEALPNPDALPALQSQVMDVALDGLPSAKADFLMYKAMQGELSVEDVRGMAEAAGKDTDEVMKGIDTAVSGIFGFLTSRAGITMNDVPELLDAIEQNNSKQDVTNAVRNLIASKDASQFLQLVNMAALKMAPSGEELREDGYRTKLGDNGVTLVFVPEAGTYMDVRVATRLELI